MKTKERNIQRIQTKKEKIRMTHFGIEIHENNGFDNLRSIDHQFPFKQFESLIM